MKNILIKIIGSIIFGVVVLMAIQSTQKTVIEQAEEMKKKQIKRVEETKISHKPEIKTKRIYVPGLSTKECLKQLNTTVIDKAVLDCTNGHYEEVPINENN